MKCYLQLIRKIISELRTPCSNVRFLTYHLLAEVNIWRHSLELKTAQEIG